MCIFSFCWRDGRTSNAGLMPMWLPLARAGQQLPLWWEPVSSRSPQPLIGASSLPCFPSSAQRSWCIALHFSASWFSALFQPQLSNATGCPELLSRGFTTELPIGLRAREFSPRRAQGSLGPCHWLGAVPEFLLYWALHLWICSHYGDSSPTVAQNQQQPSLSGGAPGASCSSAVPAYSSGGSGYM